jgi:hypothetical protein
VRRVPGSASACTCDHGLRHTAITTAIEQGQQAGHWALAREYTFAGQKGYVPSAVFRYDDAKPSLRAGALRALTSRTKPGHRGVTIPEKLNFEVRRFG